MQANVKVGGAGTGGAGGASGTGGADLAARGRDGEPLTALELGAWRGLLRAHAAMVRRLDADLRAQHGISLSGYEVLMLLGDAPRRRMRITELSGATLLSVSGISRMIDRLARERLVTREACEDDGRGQEVVLTASGRGRLRAARASHLAGVRGEFLMRFSDEDLHRMAALWARIDDDGSAG